ncbi:MAG: cation transporter [Bacteroidetes bacterium]|nr:cation transporter [Bacteroidota bacterium]MBT6687457.1 cation transporter [Bacteroidota bacterium]MBT7142274.1 cation transporter [Bacteroidota bacterium]MBT7492329.1 cation transporter [Bacteroidota bacterium]
MKKLRFIILIISMLIIQHSVAQNSKEVAVIKFKSDVKCNSCKSKIEKDMSFTKGVKSVNACIDSKIVTIRYRTDKTTAEDIEKALVKAGYGAEKQGEAVIEKKKSKKKWFSKKEQDS